VLATNNLEGPRGLARPAETCT